MNQFLKQVEMWSRGRLTYLDSCPVCQSSLEHAKVYSRRDEFLAMPDIWQMHHCDRCKSIYLNPRPDDESLPEAYSSYFTHVLEKEASPAGKISLLITALVNGYLNKKFGMQRKPSLALGFWIFSLISPLGLKLNCYGRHLFHLKYPNKGNLLDVGCGNGSFLNVAHEMGWEAMGCEPDPKAVEVCRQQGLCVVKGDIFNSELLPDSYDVITLSHVIEHVHNQQECLDRAYSLLKMGGSVWMALPNPKGLGLKIFGRHWEGHHPPYHLVIPSQEELVKIIKKSGFKDVQIIKKGAHLKRIWRSSFSIAQQNECYHSKLKIFFLRYLGDMLSSIQSKYSDETVVVAYKRVAADE